MSEIVLLTAGGGRLKSTDALETKALLDAIYYYSKLDAEVIVATSLSDGRLLSEILDSSLLRNARHVSVPDGTKGALATANYALAKLEITSGKLHIAAGDTYFKGSSALEAMIALAASSADAGTLIFPSDDERHSFVSLSESGQIQFVAEKSRIGKWATSGNFYFSDAKQFMDASAWCFTNNASLRGNFYVSSALNYFVYQGTDVQVREIDADSVFKRWPLT